MQLNSQLAIGLAVVIVPLILAIAAATLKAAILSVTLFWGALAMFFFNEIRAYIKSRKPEK